MVNKEEETVVTKEANFTIESVAAWDDAKCQELEKTVSFPLINVRDVLRTFIATDQKLQTLRTIFFRGMLRGYTIKCPECGEVTEVYSRITGYYRPVQNWNVGKTAEFKDRKTYDVSSMTVTPEERPTEPVVHHEEACECAEPHDDTLVVDHLMLFTTATCPNCKMAKMLLEKAGLVYENINAEENIELTRAFGITKAPTLLVPTNEGYEVYSNASEIKGYIEGLK